VNPLDELTRLTSQFSHRGALIEQAEHIPASTTPEPYKQMLVHDHHMTVTMEEYHGCPVNVNVLDSRLEGNVYSRKIILTRSDNGTPVQFGIVRFNFDYVTAAVKDQILGGQIPLGRVLILHNVLRHIDLGAIIEITAGPELAELLRMPEHGTTYGRLATIFCNRAPAVDLLEITAPLVTP
jgi:chorismate-pyruvate lyase